MALLELVAEHLEAFVVVGKERGIGYQSAVAIGLSAQIDLGRTAERKRRGIGAEGLPPGLAALSC